MSKNTQIVKDPTSTEPELCREGDAVAFKIVVEGVVTGITNDANLTTKFYKEGSDSDLAATYLTGSMSVSGVDTILTKTTTGLKAGNWIMSVAGTVDGQLQTVATIPIIVKRRSER